MPTAGARLGLVVAVVLAGAGPAAAQAPSRATAGNAGAAERPAPQIPPAMPCAPGLGALVGCARLLGWSTLPLRLRVDGWLAAFLSPAPQAPRAEPVRPTVLPHEGVPASAVDLGVVWTAGAAPSTATVADWRELHARAALGLPGGYYLRVDYPIVWRASPGGARGFGDLSLGGGWHGGEPREVALHVTARSTVSTAAEVVGRSPLRLESMLVVAHAWTLADREWAPRTAWLWGGGGARWLRGTVDAAADLRVGGAAGRRFGQVLLIGVVDATARQSYPSQAVGSLSTALSGEIVACGWSLCLAAGAERWSDAGAWSRTVWTLSLEGRARTPVATPSPPSRPARCARRFTSCVL